MKAMGSIGRRLRSACCLRLAAMLRFVALALLAMGHAHAGEAAPVSLLAAANATPTTLVRAWQQLVGDAAGLDEITKVKRVNRFFNTHLTYAEDSIAWGQADYWATPLQTLKREMGDCEDFAIAKYYTLREMGVPATRLRLVYTTVLNEGQRQAHMVLAYYPDNRHAPVILDNLSNTLATASARSDLTPVFSFNTDGVWVGIGAQTSRSTLSRWQDLVARTTAESLVAPATPVRLAAAY